MGKSFKHNDKYESNISKKDLKSSARDRRYQADFLGEMNGNKSRENLWRISKEMKQNDK